MRLSTRMEMSFYVSRNSISPAVKCRDIRLIGESDITNLGGIAILTYLNQYLDNIKSKWELWGIRAQSYRTYFNQ